MLKLVRLEEQNTSIETFKTRSWHAIGWLEAAVLSFFCFLFFSARVLEVGAEDYCS